MRPSSQLVHARLKALGCETALKIYPGTHAFFALPQVLLARGLQLTVLEYLETCQQTLLSHAPP